MAKKRRRNNHAPKRASAPAAKPKITQPTISAVPAGKYDHVGKEVVGTLLIAAVFVALQLALWQVFSQTNLEDGLIKLLTL